ncbi:MAG: hypothetical protein JWQ49_1908 [Edaphobacter sp.]|nr:hypothetical protein [Edaphobacter sp.]
MRRVEIVDNYSPHVRLLFLYAARRPQPRRHKVLMSFRYWNAWDVIFFDTDRMRTALPRRARFNSDEAMIEFAQRAGGIKMSEDRQILDMMIQRKTGEINS